MIAALPWASAIAVPILLLIQFNRRHSLRFGSINAWQLGLIAFGVLIVTQDLVFGRLIAALLASGEVTVALGASVFLRLDRRTLRAGYTVMLVVSLILLWGGRFWAGQAWTAGSGSQVHVRLALSTSHAIVLSSRLKDQTSTGFGKGFELRRAGPTVYARAQYKAAPSGRVHWNVGDGARIESRDGFDAIVLPRRDSWASTQFVATQSAASSVSSGHIHLKSGAKTCGTIRLAINAANGHASSEHICVGTTWTAVALPALTIPPRMGPTVINVVLAGFPSRVDARAPVVDRNVEGPHVSVSTRLNELAARFVFRSGRTILATEPIPASSIWTTWKNQFPKTTGDMSIWWQVYPTGSANLELSRWGLSSGRRSARPDSLLRRQSMALPAPNIAAHSIAVVGVSAACLASTIAGVLVPLVVAMVAIVPTGSRTAAFAVLVALVGLALFRRRHSLAALALLVGTLGSLVVLLLLLGPSAIARLLTTGSHGAMTRPEIFRVAAHALVAHPWTGIGAGLKAALASAAPAGAGIPVHAHDLWLQYAATNGVLGLVAAIVLTLGMATFVLRHTRWATFLLLTVFILNTLDFTLWNAAILLPLTLTVFGREPQGIGK